MQAFKTFQKERKLNLIFGYQDLDLLVSVNELPYMV